jgi:hypothetical protein
MRKPLELWQALVSALIILGSSGAFVLDQTNQIERQAVRIQILEEQQRDDRLLFRDIQQQFKETNNKLTDILVILQNKEDRSSNRNQ